jgi:hypothetical protein
MGRKVGLEKDGTLGIELEGNVILIPLLWV